MSRQQIAKALLVTYEIIGSRLSDEAANAILDDLVSYPEADVLIALARCRKEVHKIALADILDRLPNGHPGPEEAWAIVAPTMSDENITVVWTDEIAEAFGVALTLSSDTTASRMAFKEKYTELIRVARIMNKPPTWRVSLGHDVKRREHVIENAVQKGRITRAHANKFLPPPDTSDGGNFLTVKGF